MAGSVVSGCRNSAGLDDANHISRSEVFWVFLVPEFDD